MNVGEVEEFVQRSQQLIEASPQMAEETTKVRLIQPFLELLGWDLYSTEVEPEYTVPMATGSTHVDYALLIGDSPVVFVEVKPLRTDLSDGNVTQLRSYMRQELDVDWGILTNGSVFEVLTKDRQRTSGEEVSVIRFELDELTENPEVLELLSKEAIRSGRADEIARQVAKTNEAIVFLQENEDEVTESVRLAVEEHLGDIPLDLEQQSREFVQNITAVLQEQRQFVSEDSPSVSEDETTESVDEEPAIEPKRSHVAKTIRRSDIEGDPESRVAVFPTRETGLPFLLENEAWGFVRIGSDFDYVAMYVTGDVREVQYIAEVGDIVEPTEANLEREPEEYVDRAKIAEDKLVIKFKPGTLYELEDPIPYETEYPQSLRYTTLAKLKSADTTDKLF